MLHFAYGSNMSRTLMHRRCPTATPLGAGRLAGWRFIITRDGYASVVPAPGAVVHGVLWRLAPRDLCALNAYESLDSGLYRRRVLAVSRGGRAIAALVYVGRQRGEGRPRPGYQELVVAAACDWQMPEDYIRALRRWSPTPSAGVRARETGEIA
jgi:hypothetical protein